MTTRYAIYAHDFGEVEFCETADTLTEAKAIARKLRKEFDDHPTWYDGCDPWFEVRKETY